MLNEFYDLSHKVRVVKSYNNGQRLITVFAEHAYLNHDVLIWSNCSDEREELDPALVSLLNQIAKWTGGWEDANAVDDE